MIIQLATCFLTTLSIFSLTLLGAVPLGLAVYFGQKSRIPPIRWLIKIYISIMRGTPLMLQMMVVFYGPNLLLGISVPKNWYILPLI